MLSNITLIPKTILSVLLTASTFVGPLALAVDAGSRDGGGADPLANEFLYAGRQIESWLIEDSVPNIHENGQLFRAEIDKIQESLDGKNPQLLFSDVRLVDCFGAPKIGCVHTDNKIEIARLGWLTLSISGKFQVVAMEIFKRLKTAERYPKALTIASMAVDRLKKKNDPLSPFNAKNNAFKIIAGDNPVDPPYSKLVTTKAGKVILSACSVDYRGEDICVGIGRSSGYSTLELLEHHDKLKSLARDRKNTIENAGHGTGLVFGAAGLTLALYGGWKLVVYSAILATPAAVGIPVIAGIGYHAGDEAGKGVATWLLGDPQLLSDQADALSKTAFVVPGLSFKELKAFLTNAVSDIPELPQAENLNHRLP